MITLVKDFNALLQIVCDPENQPHQFIGDEKSLKKAFEVSQCKCLEPPPLGVDDLEIRVCATCNCITLVEGGAVGNATNALGW